MNLLRNFWIEVVGVDKPKVLNLKPIKVGGADDVQDIEQQAEAAEEQADAAELQARAAADKARIMERLADLAGPYKEAVADNGPDAPRLHALFHTIKTSISKEQFTEAAEGLDQLEQLLAQHSSPVTDSDEDLADLENLVAPPSGKQIGQQGPESVAAPGEKGDLVKGIGPSVGDNPVFPNPCVATCKITNHTDQTLHLDPQSLETSDDEDKVGISSGHYKKAPADPLPKGDNEFIATSDGGWTPIGYLYPEGAVGIVRYFLDDQKTTAWKITFHVPRSGTNWAQVAVEGPNKDNFQTSEGPAGQGEDASFSFTLDPKGGPPPPPPPPPPPGPAVNLSCRITVTNKTQYVLMLISQEGDSNHPKIGDYITNPDKLVLQPGDSTSCVFGQTTNKKDDNNSIQGSLLWQVGSPAVTTWCCVWVNPVGVKNTARHEFDPDTKEFLSPDQIDEGDENVPVTFTLLGGGQGPPPPPKQEKQAVQYKPPKPEKQPTLKLNDPNNDDGWVEYLQEQLNEQLLPEDEEVQKYKVKLPLDEDGKFTPNVKNAVLAFQTKAQIRNPSFLVDGIVGNQTWAALRHGTPEKPGVRGHKLDTGLKARWLTEDEVCIYTKGSDTITLRLVSVGTVDLKDVEVNVFVSPPGGKDPGTGYRWKIGPPVHVTETGEGNVHEVSVPNISHEYELPTGTAVENCRIEAYFDQELGNDDWSTDKGKIVLK